MIEAPANTNCMHTIVHAVYKFFFNMLVDLVGALFLLISPQERCVRCLP
jgi:hypothetical protein